MTTDVVTQSVAVYSDHAADYAAYNADKMIEKGARFLAALPAGGDLLDAGCGPGRDLARFVAAGMNAQGLDLNADFVSMASEHGPAIQGDLRNLPWPMHSFDGVWACASLVHLPTVDAALAVSEFARVLRPGGRAYASVKIAGETGWSDTPHGRRWFQIWTPQDFADVFTAAGLVVDEVNAESVFVDVWAHKPA